VNLAIGAFPSLRQPAIETESRRWQALLQLAEPGHALHSEVRTSHIGFVLAARRLDARFNGIRRACWLVSLIATSALTWASFRADEKANTWLAAILLALGATPGVALLVLNWHASRVLKVSSLRRQALEQTVPT
jgi:hypothetical protein